ncbi:MULTISPECIES: chaperone NapD [unclassified Pseudomonas]|uniref:chaperone NapD n=1 Tax=unclassified Pseudomonas TaxID=196821 RepID=UPI00244B95AF|nr:MULTISPECIES: chaperone NapD [unclassified Pseudomonas]MDG9924286.1 chaperone NapD [Pseudomonas sp. GD04045]MDH0033327.1 chaperone NapD [Pseudomonas sp. GD04019]
MPDSIQIASLIVHTQPALMVAVKANLRRLPGLELHQESPQGKLVVVLEAEDEAQILTTLDAIQNLPGVLNAALVYHEVLEEQDSPAHP